MAAPMRALTLTTLDWGPFINHRFTARGSAQIALNPRSWQEFIIDRYGYWVRVYTRTFAVD